MIEAGRPRELFAAWVGDALANTRPPPSGLAAAYLVDLLAGRVRAAATADPAGPSQDPEATTLAEAWLRARVADGAARLSGLRAVGDRALFVAGFFGPSLKRTVVGIDYYRDIGQAAYGDLSARLSGGDGQFARLYRELAERFGDCIAVLARVGDRARPAGEDDLLHLHERWLATGDETARRSLLAHGCLVADRGGRNVQ
jgi:hypothetical protein